MRVCVCASVRVCECACVQGGFVCACMCVIEKEREKKREREIVASLKTESKKFHGKFSQAGCFVSETHSSFRETSSPSCLVRVQV